MQYIIACLFHCSLCAVLPLGWPGLSLFMYIVICILFIQSYLPYQNEKEENERNVSIKVLDVLSSVRYVCFGTQSGH